MNKKIVLNCEKLCKSYTDTKTKTLHILKNIDFSLRSGERIAIIGASGSGKSTLLHILAGLDNYDSGKVFWHSQEISKLKNYHKLRNQTLGFIYQFHYLLMEFSVLENICLALLIRKQMSIAKIKQRAIQLLQKINLKDKINAMPQQLSGGERQRVAIARAIITQPAFILADEPTGNLDINTANKVFDILLQMQQEEQSALLLVTHNLNLTKQFDKVFELKNNTLLQI